MIFFFGRDLFDEIRVWKNAASLGIYLNVDLVYGRRKNSFCMIRIMRDEGVVEEAKAGVSSGLCTYIRIYEYLGYEK